MNAGSPKIVASLRWPLRLTLITLALFVTYAGLRAISEAVYNDGFPEALAVKVELLPIVFPVHMVTGGLSLLLVPITLFARGTTWHRFWGRLTASDILLAGVTAPFVAWAAPVTVVSAAGFTAQSVVWVGLLLVGVWNIRHGRIVAHQNCMLLVAAVTSGALFFRIYLALWAGYGDRHYFKDFYALDAWIAWMLPLFVMAMILRYKSKTRASLNSA